MTTFKYFLKNSFHIIFTYGPFDALSFFVNYFKYRKEINLKIALVKSDFEINNPGESFNKYLDTSYWIFENLKRIYHLNLHKKNSQLILDLGAGAGYFAYLCKKYGHNVTALDMDNNPMYNSIIELLEINRINHKISFGRNLPLPEGLKFDLVTAFMICFNNHKEDNLWHLEEWDWFLKFLIKHLQLDGKIFLSFNEESTLNPIDKNLYNYFKKYNHIANHLEFLLTPQEKNFFKN